MGVLKISSVSMTWKIMTTWRFCLCLVLFCLFAVVCLFVLFRVAMLTVYSNANVSIFKHMPIKGHHFAMQFSRAKKWHDLGTPKPTCFLYNDANSRLYTRALNLQWTTAIVPCPILVGSSYLEQFCFSSSHMKRGAFQPQSFSLQEDDAIKTRVVSSLKTT